MTGAILGLTAGFIFVVILLLILTLRTRFHWGIKAATIVVATLFYVVTLKTLPGFYGWPTQQSLPDNFRLMGVEINEPRNESEQGVIYIWVKSLNEPNSQPRAYELPYQPELHTRLNEARKRMEFGNNIAGEMKGDKSGSKRGGLPRFYILEKRRPPPKNAD